MSLKLYLISQNHNTGYDTYDSAVVCAATEEEARLIIPGGGSAWRKELWPREWVSPDHVRVQLIGTAEGFMKPGEVLASFNAG